MIKQFVKRNLIVIIVPTIMIMLAGYIAFNMLHKDTVNATTLQPPQNVHSYEYYNPKGISSIEIFWTKGNLAKETVIMITSGHFAKDINDGTIVYKGEGEYFYYEYTSSQCISLLSIDEEGNLSEFRQFKTKGS